jgi:hypothetical protein
MLHLLKISFAFLLLFINPCLFSASVDFDVIVVGTSPIPLLEALYHYHTGKRVLILEEASVCGGAWKSIEACGLYPVDLGCHTLGNDKQMLHFLQEYIGCEMVSLDNPHLPFDAGHSPNGFYFAHGCYELMQNLLQLIEKTDIVLLLDHALESVWIDEQEPIAIAKTKDGQFTTSKILVTPYSRIRLDNPLPTMQSRDKTKYYHLYMLIEDSTPPRFSFKSGIGKGISRLMNLTYFAGIEGTGKQLMVFQTYGDTYQQSAETYLERLKQQNLIDASARILQTETYVYEQDHFQHPQNIDNAKKIFEPLKTNHLQEMSQYISKWKQILQPFQLAIQE